MRSLLAGFALAALCFLLFVVRAPAATAAATVATAAPAAASPGENPLRGKILFLRCAACHDVTATPSAKIGPNLRGVIGRQVASLEGFKYSPALKSQNFVWDAAHLDAWLTNPNTVAPGTAMAFAGMPEAADRQALIRYLETQHGDAP